MEHQWTDIKLNIPNLECVPHISLAPKWIDMCVWKMKWNKTKNNQQTRKLEKCGEVENKTQFGAFVWVLAGIYYYIKII